MTTPLRRRLRLARRGAWYVVAIALVTMALLAGVVSQLLPLAERHPARIAAWLSERAGRPVHFDKVETRWTRGGPLLRLDGMRVGDGAQAVVIGDVEMLVSQYAGLLPGHSFTQLRLRGLDLTLERAADGRWGVHGLPGQDQAPAGDPFDTLEGLGELQIIGARLRVIAPDMDIDARLPRVDVRLRVDGPRLRAGARAWPQAGRTPAEAVIDFDRDNGNGRAWFASKRAELAAWTPLLRGGGVAVVGGNGSAQAWAELRAHRVAAVTVDAQLDDVRLRGAPLPAMAAMPGAAGASSRFDQVQARVRWRALAGGWRVDAPRLRIVSGSRTQTLDGLVLAGGQRYGLLADEVDAGPLFAALALSDRIAPGVRRWLLQSRPQAILRDIVVSGRRGGAMHADGRIDGFGFAPVGDAPGLSGLAGQLDGDDRGMRFVFDPASPVRFDWPAGFGVAHTFALHGEAVAWQEAGGWAVASPTLRLAGDAVDATFHGGLLFRTGGAPRIDMTAELRDVPVVASHGFWVHYLMSPETTRWLDAALLGGVVHDGRAVISGDLSQWPFAAQAGPTPAAGASPRSGMFRATGRIQGATLKFDPKWPAFEHVDADVVFAGNGFHVAGQGVLDGVGVRHFEGQMADFAKPELQVTAEGGGDAARLLVLLRHSPLHDSYGDSIDNITASGLAAVTFRLQQPFHSGGRSVLDGTVTLAGARLAEKRWDIAFDHVRGRARYGDGGFDADKLDVIHDGQAGKLSLRAGGFTRDRRQAFEADLQASVAADDLLRRAPALDWLQPYVSGSSSWTVGVAIPRGSGKQAAVAPSRLRLHSDLVGTTLALPAPLRKAASVSLPTSIDTALPLGSGETTVALGNLLAARARGGDRSPAAMRIVVGAGSVTQPPPASGLVVGGHAGTLDALDWIAVVKGSGNQGNQGNRGSGSMPLRALDVSADRLVVAGGVFPSARLQIAPTAGGLAVQVQGEALAGVVRVPDADGAIVSGQFQRVHWRALPVSTAGAGAVAPAGADIDPAKIPPLALDIADLRFGDARLGGAVLRTRPLAAGMHVDRLQTRAPGQRIDIAGDWTGRGNAARTQLSSTLDSDDFGALLAGLGYGGQLARGHGKAQFDASWSGGPASFRLQALSGTLKLGVRDGQLTEVEPGAGRVLGLLSLAQLPRRLTLDFHDFFSKGFAFDRLEGDVRIDAGRAHTDNLVINGPAAELRIRGTTDLAAQQFDQTIDVFPKAGNLLTVAGALAGGPVGAAIGAAANAMLKKPLGRLASKTYRVTGPWKDPKVEIISREQSRQETVPAGPPPG